MAFPFDFCETVVHKASKESFSIRNATLNLPLAKGKDQEPIIPSESLFEDLYSSPNQESNSATTLERLPSIAECAIHLELLEAFLILKQKVLTSNALERTFSIQPRDTLVTKSYTRKRERVQDTTFQRRRLAKWPIFLGLASARFIRWCNNIDRILSPEKISDVGGHQIQLRITDANLPPLDVLMAWHSFLLNPKSYQAFCESNDLSNLFDLAFPWPCIHRAIDNNDRSFKLSQEAAALFKSTTGESDNLFESLADFGSHTEPLHSLYKNLVNLEDEEPAPVTKYGPTVITPYKKAPDQPEWAAFEKFFSESATLLGSQSISQNELVVVAKVSYAVERQAVFVEKMGRKLWIRSPGVKGTLQRAIKRYEQFMALFKQHPSALLVPTLDIDLVWHTQQCSPRLYERYCERHAGRFINHNDTLGKRDLDDGMKNTKVLYESEYKEGYDPCLCWDCEALKAELEGADPEADLERICKKVSTDVAYHKAVEAARRSRKLLPVGAYMA